MGILATGYIAADHCGVALLSLFWGVAGVSPAEGVAEGLALRIDGCTIGQAEDRGKLSPTK